MRQVARETSSKLDKLQSIAEPQNIKITNNNFN